MPAAANSARSCRTDARRATPGRPASSFLHCHQRNQAAAVVNAIGAIVRAAVIEKECLKAAPGCGTFCLPERSGVSPEGPPKVARPAPPGSNLLLPRSRDFNLPGCKQTAMTSVSRQARQTVRPPTGLFHWAGGGKQEPTARTGIGAVAIAARIALSPLAGAPQTEDDTQ